ncbi:hypothetical protein VOLCADRAFT_108497 [Volvox carteri f. nagariensis]|uniref:Uncharacterized protein n=1 Tax=Volvox carteri f. nagariensis TaxID=3068 RepID=D8UKG3_VOLCA|nr:uncharacterized protein VOLCADRAFT_108497 [Volvox carteri f. nagariensis]EFJ39778.1 hypothetical protein VOLCADRAFT_108497 [Volvox carteri f. nagariensis]|eukprot:XP_002959155.1 hypothetical protein VOLCADRAFT_108497 [Volvox carteri f. nagariensis]
MGAACATQQMARAAPWLDAALGYKAPEGAYQLDGFQTAGHGNPGGVLLVRDAQLPTTHDLAHHRRDQSGGYDDEVAAAVVAVAAGYHDAPVTAAAAAAATTGLAAQHSSAGPGWGLYGRGYGGDQSDGCCGGHGGFTTSDMHGLGQLRDRLQWNTEMNTEWMYHGDPLMTGGGMDCSYQLHGGVTSGALWLSGRGDKTLEGVHHTQQVPGYSSGSQDRGVVVTGSAMNHQRLSGLQHCRQCRCRQCRQCLRVGVVGTDGGVGDSGPQRIGQAGFTKILIGSIGRAMNMPIEAEA